MDSSLPSSDDRDQSVQEKESSKQTESNVNEQELDDDAEEEFLIMADIGHDIDQQTVLQHASKSEIRAIDIDGTNPFLQIGPYTFQGQYNYVLGTNLFFSTTNSNDETSSTKDESQVNNVSTSNNELEFIGLSDKKLNLSRVYIYPKKPDDPPSNS